MSLLLLTLLTRELPLTLPAFIAPNAPVARNVAREAFVDGYTEARLLQPAFDLRPDLLVDPLVPILYRGHRLGQLHGVGGGPGVGDAVPPVGEGGDPSRALLPCQSMMP